MKETRAFVDRIEGEKAVLLLGENEESTVVIPVAFLPEEAREGAVLTLTLKYEPERTAEAAQTARDLIDKLRNRR